MGDSDVRPSLVAKRAGWRELAEAARDKKAVYGPDIDLDSFRPPDAHRPVASLDELEQRIRESALYAGVEADESEKAGTYFQIDHSVVYENVQKAFQGQIEIMSTEDALEKYEWMEEYWWNAVAVDADKYTARAELEPTHGYFIRVLEGQKVERPIQACLFLSENEVSQNVHNIVIMEEGSEATIITGCSTHPQVERGVHIGVSEFYLKKGSQLTFDMIHNWAESFDVRPRSGIVIGEDASYVNNYVLLKPVNSIQMYPASFLRGDRSRARFNAILTGLEDSYVDIGSKAIMEGAGSRAESIARAVSAGSSVMYSRGQLIARTNDCKAHLDCRGILFSEGSSMYAIPELVSEGAPGAELSHEAAISPIAEEEVEYLMARGLTQDEAVSTITRGFLNIEMGELPALLRADIDRVLTQASKEAM